MSIPLPEPDAMNGKPGRPIPRIAALLGLSGIALATAVMVAGAHPVDHGPIGGPGIRTMSPAGPAGTHVTPAPAPTPRIQTPPGFQR